MTEPVLNRRVWLLLYVLLAVVGLALALNLLPYHRDDAYITYRYAAHFAAGDGIVFNRGGPWTEGFSSPIWFLLLAGLAAVFPPQFLPVWGVTLGMLSFGSVFYVIWRLSSYPESDVANDKDWCVWRPLIAGGLAGLLPAVCYYSATGLETLLFLLVVLVFAGTVARQLPSHWGVVAGLAAVWVRPEGGWLLVMAVMQLAAEGRLRELKKPVTWLPLAAVLLACLLLLVARLIAFHEFLPNTYYAKVPDYLSGIRYVADGLLSPWGGGVFLCGLAGAWGGGAKTRGYFVAGLAWLGAAFLEGGDWMPLGRMLLPAFALFGVAAVGLADIWGRFAEQGGRRLTRVALTLGGVLVLLVISASVRATLRETGYAKNALVSFHEETLQVLELVARSGARSIGLTDIGEVGFRSGLEIVDFAGLTDALIAHAPGGHLGKEFDLDYLYGVRRPDLLLFRLRRPPVAGEDGSDMYPPEIIKWYVEYRIMSDSRFAQQYRLFCGLVPGYARQPYDGIVIFRRVDFVPGAAAYVYLNALQSGQTEHEP